MFIPNFTKHGLQITISPPVPIVIRSDPFRPSSGGSIPFEVMVALGGYQWDPQDPQLREIVVPEELHAWKICRGRRSLKTTLNSRLLG